MQSLWTSHDMGEKLCTVERLLVYSITMKSCIQYGFTSPTSVGIYRFPSCTRNVDCWCRSLVHELLHAFVVSEGLSCLRWPYQSCTSTRGIYGQGRIHQLHGWSGAWCHELGWFLNCQWSECLDTRRVWASLDMMLDMSALDTSRREQQLRNSGRILSWVGCFFSVSRMPRPLYSSTSTSS